VIDLTLSAYGAEPPLGPPLPSSGTLSLVSLGLSCASWTVPLRCRRLRVLSTVLVTLPSSFRFGVGNGTSSTKLNHVNGTLAARDQMTARQKNNFTWRGKANETFRGRLAFRRWGHRRIGVSGVGGRLRGLSVLG
jgi:hypothetical protein